MLFGNVLELKQICSRSTTTTLSSLRREGKKTYLIMLLLGHLKHRVDVWNEEKKMLGMGLINSVELWVCHFLGTKSCRRSKHAQIYKIKKKKIYEPLDSGAQIDCLWRQERSPFVQWVFGLHWSESNGLPLKCLVLATVRHWKWICSLRKRGKSDTFFEIYLCRIFLKSYLA